MSRPTFTFALYDWDLIQPWDGGYVYHMESEIQEIMDLIVSERTWLETLPENHLFYPSLQPKKQIYLDKMDSNLTTLAKVLHMYEQKEI